jgi:hypothetical protein
LPRGIDVQFPNVDAMGALLYLDECLGSKHASRFLAQGGLWDKSPMSQHDPAKQHRHLARLCAFADDCMSVSGDQRDTPETLA